MADAAVQDGQAPTSPREDAPPSSADSQPAPVEAPTAPPALSDELKARLDKVIYSDVCLVPFIEMGRGSQSHRM